MRIASWLPHKWLLWGVILKLYWWCYTKIRCKFKTRVLHINLMKESYCTTYTQTSKIFSLKKQHWVGYISFGDICITSVSGPYCINCYKLFRWPSVCSISLEIHRLYSVSLNYAYQIWHGKNKIIKIELMFSYFNVLFLILECFLL